MSIFKRKSSLTELEQEELRDFVGRTVEVMLTSKEETIFFIKKYDLILIFSWDKEYIEGCIYHYSTFNVSNSGLSNLRNIPLYEEQRHFRRNEDTKIYMEVEKIAALTRRNQTAFYYLSHLINEFEVEVHSSGMYKCIW